MRSFKDNAGRTWIVSVNVATIKRVRALTGADLLDLSEGRIIERLSMDPVLLCDVIYAICKPDADSMSLTDEDFGRAMGGDAIELATEAVLAEIVDFSRSPRERQALGRILELSKTAKGLALDQAEKNLAELTPEKLLDMIRQK